MYFILNSPLHCYEVMMQGVPNFKPRGCGVRYGISPIETTCEYCLYFKRKKCMHDRCPFIDDKVASGTATIGKYFARQIYEETFKNIKHPKFRLRLEQYIRECEGKPMTYFDKHHETEFQRTIINLNNDNFALLSAVYLLTAEFGLWRKSRNAVEYGRINFDKIKLGSVGERGYTLYACASDLYKGTKLLTIADLCDTDMISPKMFGVICNAMAIRRFGFGAINCDKGGGKID